MKKLIMALALTTAVAAPAAAQQNGLVNVAVGDVILRNILNNNEVKILNDNNILTDNQFLVQVPVGIAANVCNVSAAVLGAAGSGGECTAKSGSQALAQAIRKQHLRKK